jgi:UDP-N-acetylglucosamine 1-carboxyvinyltransferase
MSSFEITGPCRMSGEITPQGAKNEALQVICATLLTSEEVIIDNVPDILDVNNLIALLRKMGVEVRYLGPNRYSFRAADVDIHYMQTDDFRSTSPY